MPFETVNEQVYRQRQVKVCARCRRPIPEAVQNRGAYNTAGSIAGSLGTSMAGGALVGAALGPVGAIGGAITGAIVGSRVGAAASDGVCDVVESSSADICEECQKGPASTGQTQWGGGRLGTGGEPGKPLNPSAPAAPQEAGIGSTLSDAGTAIGGAASTAGTAIGGAASATGEKLGQGWSWLRSSVGGYGSSQEPPKAPAPAKGGSFQAFQGSGRTLGASEPTERPKTNPSRLLAAAGGGDAARPAATQPSTPQAAPASTAPPAQAAPAQVEDDEAMARRLQQQFAEEDAQQGQ